MASTWIPIAAPALAQAGAVFAFTFVSEDAAALGAAVIVASGALSWPLGFAAAFLGIWLGDLWLYAMARLIGAPFLKRMKCDVALERSRARLARSGSFALILIRFVPGLRLPGYLAAGAVSFPLARFVLVTGLAAAVWVTGIFFTVRWLGVGEISWLQQHASSLAFGLLGLVVAGLLFHSFRQSAAAARLRLRLQRLTKWEFWPMGVFYAPVALFYFWLSLRHRGFGLPTAANPGLPLGGLVGESKFAILDALQSHGPAHTAATWFLAPAPPPARFDQLLEILQRESIEVPFILKPDVGQRGAGVKLIRSLAEARGYFEDVSAAVVLQRYASGPREAGIFYYRLPGERSGRIFAITDKVFPEITGDGFRSVEALILADPRAAQVADTYLRRHADRRSEILAAGATLKLVEAGNHSQGCIFRDGSHLLTPALVEAFDPISQAIPGFFIGRYDVRYASDEELRAGRGFTILELNGAGAEATNIYDTRNSLWYAYRTLYRQWELVFRIGALNRARGFAPASGLAILREWRRTSQLIAAHPAAD